jgi:hypothetical protein
VEPDRERSREKRWGEPQSGPAPRQQYLYEHAGSVRHRTQVNTLGAAAVGNARNQGGMDGRGVGLIQELGVRFLLS